MAILDQQDVWAAYEELFYQTAKAPRDFGITSDAIVDLLGELTQRVGQDNRLQALIQKLADGTTTYSDLDEFALLLGKHLGNAMYDALPAYATWGDGYITRQIADAIIPAGLRTNYDAIVEYAAVTQKGLNTRAQLGLNAVTPSYDYEREKGLIDYITEKPWNDRAKSFRDAVQENGQYYADESAKVNAKAHYNAGLQPVIKRIAAWRCFKWCSNLAGTYDYSPNMDTDVFRRHSNCNCKVLFDPKDGKGRLQNAHTKQWATKDELAERKKHGLLPDTITPQDRIEQAAASLRSTARGRNVATLKDLQGLSNSNIIKLDTYNDIVTYFANNYDIRVLGFDKKALEAVKVTFAGIDDVLTRYPEAAKFLREIKYNSHLKVYGKVNEYGYMQIGTTGLSSYSTGLHEAIHAYDWATGASGDIIEQAAKTLGIKVGTDKWTRLAYDICGTLAYVNNAMELLAYSYETEKAGGIGNKLSQIIVSLLEG